MLRIEQRLVREADGERVDCVELVESLRVVLGWARPKSYAGER